MRARLRWRDEYIERLHRDGKKKDKRIEELSAENDEFHHRVRLNSENSSKPPSSDPPHLQRRSRSKPTGRKPGGQAGHPGAFRKPVPPEQVDEIKDYWPAACEHCRTAFVPQHSLPMVVDPISHQVVEIPPLRARVVEHRRHALACLKCGGVTRAELPPEVPHGSFGPRLQALVGDLSGKVHASKRDIVEVMGDYFGVEISAGSVIACQKAVSDALEKPVDEVRAYIEKQPVVHADETGWREARRRGWLWLAVCLSVAYFLIRAKRSRAVSYELLGKFAGILVSDRFTAYDDRDPNRRQLCWSHLNRDFTGWSERTGAAGELGKALLELTEKQMFSWWHRVRDGTMSRAEFVREMAPLKEKVKALLEGGATGAIDKVSATCRFLLKVWPALWTFVTVEGVEPTNNFAERTLRPAVLWRKSSLGTHSEQGSRFVERMMTATATLKLQQRNVLDYLTAAVQAHHLGESAPSLLPKDAEQPMAIAA